MRLALTPRRSALYMPALNAKAIAKARVLPTDMVILDLEDAVAPDAKESARAAALAAVAEGGFGPREILIRANAVDTPWGMDDLAAIAASGAGGVLVPKVDSTADVHACHDALNDAPANFSLWVMIETCAAVTQLDAIARAAADTRLAGFVMGTNDLAKEMRARLTPDRAAFQPILVLALTAARAHGLAILDGVCNEFDDLDRFRAECEQGAMFGFDGKTLIHPRQIEPCNAVFSPGESDIRWAEQVIAAFALPENARKGALRVDGKMVELLHLEEAHRVQATMAAIADRASSGGA